MSEEFWDGYHLIAAAWKNIFRLERCQTDTGLCKTCDAGCGRGQFIFALRNIGVEAWGFDKQAIENRHEKCQSEWVLNRDATMTWPYGNRAFDLVIAVDLLEYIHQKDIDRVLEEMYRVAKKWIFLRITTQMPIKPKGTTTAGPVTLQDRQFWVNTLLDKMGHKWGLRDDMVQRFIELVPKNIVGDWTNSTIIILERLKRKDYDKNTLETIFDNAINKKKENINVPDKKREFDKDLTDLLVKNKDMNFGIAEPGGNSGDLLIYKGLYKKLRDLNIKYEDVRHGGGDIKFGKAEIVLMQGGSNVNDLWGSGTKLLKNIISSCKLPIIVAPQTYYFIRTDFPEIFKGSTQKIYLFCREEESYSRLKKMPLPGNVSIHVSDDTAFYMKKEDFSDYGQHNIGKGKDYALLCFRGDHESTFRDVEGIGPKIIGILREIVRDHNIEIIERDLSMDIYSWISFDYFVRYISGAKIVITDRLHVGILAAILEKPTILFSGGYFKSRAVHEYTLKYFPNVIFLE